MRNQKVKAPQSSKHESKGGRVFQGNEKSEGGKGHDLMNSNSSTDGVGQEIKSPADAKKH